MGCGASLVLYKRACEGRDGRGIGEGGDWKSTVCVCASLLCVGKVAW